MLCPSWHRTLVCYYTIIASALGKQHLIVGKSKSESGINVYKNLNIYIPGDLGTRKRPGTSCKIEIHFWF